MLFVAFRVPSRKARVRCPWFLKPLLTLAVCAHSVSCLADGGGNGGEALYNKSCSMCHGMDGKGRTKIGLKLGAKDLGQSKLDDAELEKQIREGRRGEDGSLKMPAFKENLNAAEMKALIAYVKQFRK